MTRPQDAPLLAALEQQYYDLAAQLARVERLHSELAMPTTAGWHGGARQAFQHAIAGVLVSVDACAGALRSAQGNTGVAIMQVSSRV